MLATAVDVGTTLRFVASARLDVVSANYEGRVNLDPAEMSRVAPPREMPEWGRYVWAAFTVLRDRMPARPIAFTGRIEGRLPAAGLSSSASVLLAYLNAWASVNEISLTPREQVNLAVDAENEGIGVACGVLDPAAIVGSERGRLLLIDSDSVSWERVERDVADESDEDGYSFLVFVTGKERHLVSTDFNRRVTECRDAARWASQRLGAPEVDRLGDVDRAALRSLIDDMPTPLQGRARHFVSESDRVERGRKAWSAGRLEEFGGLMNDSCRSSVANYETGSKELIVLQQIWESTAGVLGARFSGAGFGGCSVALVRAEAALLVREQVLARFTQAFPELTQRAEVIAVASADGLGVS